LQKLILNEIHHDLLFGGIHLNPSSIKNSLTQFLDGNGTSCRSTNTLDKVYPSKNKIYFLGLTDFLNDSVLRGGIVHTFNVYIRGPGRLLQCNAYSRVRLFK